MKKLEEMQVENDQKFSDIFEALEYLLHPPVSPRNHLGYKRGNDKE
jgi:hypothetical protein